MFIEKDGLKELVERRAELKAEIIKQNEVVDEHTKAVQKIRQESGQLHQEFGEVNKQINELVLADALEECGETQVPNEMIIKDGKPFMTFMDFIDRAKKEAEEAKAVWRKQYGKSTE